MQPNKGTLIEWQAEGSRGVCCTSEGTAPSSPVLAAPQGVASTPQAPPAVPKTNQQRRCQGCKCNEFAVSFYCRTSSEHPMIHIKRLQTYHSWRACSSSNCSQALGPGAPAGCEHTYGKQVVGSHCARPARMGAQAAFSSAWPAWHSAFAAMRL